MRKFLLYTFLTSTPSLFQFVLLFKHSHHKTEIKRKSLQYEKKIFNEPSFKINKACCSRFSVLNVQRFSVFPSFCLETEMSLSDGKNYNIETKMGFHFYRQKARWKGYFMQQTLFWLKILLTIMRCIVESMLSLVLTENC